MKKLRVGILGCANIAEKYAIPAFRSLANVELVAIASREKSKAEEWGARNGLEAETYESLLGRSDIDVLYSPLPVGLQEEMVLKAAESGKHILCEKSITYSLESAEKMVAACKAHNVALYENFVPEFHPQHAKVLSLIAEGKLGKRHVWTGCDGYPPRSADDIRYRSDLKGGSLNYAGCYTVFMARKIMEQEPKAVTCRFTYSDAGIDIAGSALLEFEEGEALMSFGFDHLYQNTYTVWGSEGIVRTNRAFAIPPTLAPALELITNDGKAEHREEIAVPAANQFALSFEFFTAAVAANNTARFEEMYDRILRQARVLDAMRVSAQEGRRVTL